MKLALFATLIFGLAACAMSPQTLGRLGEAVYARNERARADAEAALKKRGYRLAPDEELYLSLGELHRSLDEDARDSCAMGQLPETKDAPPITLHVSALQRADRPTPPVVEVSAPASAVCAFFANRARGELEVTRDGARHRLTAIPADAALAHGPSGELVYVVDRPHVTKRRVLVEQSCNHMPTVEPRPFVGMAPPPIRVRWSTPETVRLREVPLVYESESLDVDCTENVY